MGESGWNVMEEVKVIFKGREAIPWDSNWGKLTDNFSITLFELITLLLFLDEGLGCNTDHHRPLLTDVSNNLNISKL